MTPDIQAQIDLLDTTYQKLSGFRFKASGAVTGREYAWAAYLKAGFNVQDLDTVLVSLNRKIKEGTRFEGSKRFSTLVGNLDRMDEELGLALAEKRHVKPAITNRERVIAQARPTVVQPRRDENTAKPISFYIEELRNAVNKP